MKVFTILLVFATALLAFTIVNKKEKNSNDQIFVLENIVSTETLNENENLNISEALGNITIADAKVFTMKDGKRFLEYTTNDATFRTSKIQTVYRILLNQKGNTNINLSKGFYASQST